MLFTSMPNQDSLQDYLQIERKFSTYIDFLANNVCHNLCPTQFIGDNYRIRCPTTGNHKGAFVRLVSHGPRIKAEDLQKWVEDSEHGLLHGIFVGFFALYYKYRNDPPYSLTEALHHHKLIELVTEDERLLVSCLFHDLLKSFGHEQEGHDKDLITLIPHLVPETYSHTEPSNSSHPLVVGDRMELMRYKDHKEWVNMEVLQSYFSPQEFQEIELLERHIRPALAKLFEDINDVWIRHGPEFWDGDLPKNFSAYAAASRCGSYPPPECYWTGRSDDPSYFAIEIGTLPVRGCLLHGYDWLGTNDPSAFGPYGMMSVSNYKKFHPGYGDSPFEKKLSPCIKLDEWGDPHPNFGMTVEDLESAGLPNVAYVSREHLCAKGPLPTSEWIFLYDDNRHYKEPDLRDRGEYKLKRDWCSLFPESGGVVNLHLANKVIETAILITTYLRVLRT